MTSYIEIFVACNGVRGTLELEHRAECGDAYERVADLGECRGEPGPPERNTSKPLGLQGLVRPGVRHPSDAELSIYMCEVIAFEPN